MNEKFHILVAGNTQLPYASEVLFANALRRAGHRVDMLYYPSFSSDYSYFSDLMDSQIEATQPQLIICHKVPDIDKDMMDKWREKSNIKWIQYTYDLFYGHKNKVVREKWYQDQLHKFDIAFGAEDEKKAHEIYNKKTKYFYLPEGCDITHSVVAPSPDYWKYKADVMFTGNAYNKERMDMINMIQSLPLKFKHHTNTYLGELAKACSVTKLAVNTNYRNDLRYFSARNIELPAMGICTLAHKTPNLSEFFKDGEEIIMWTDLDNLKEKIGYLMGNDELRKEIAIKGALRCVGSHTWNHRVEEFFKILKREKII